jgi:hypothetical protein
MLTWLDILYRKTAEIVDEKWQEGDPRRALALHLAQEVLAFHNGVPPENILSEVFNAMLMPFVVEFMPRGASLTMEARSWRGRLACFSPDQPPTCCRPPIRSACPTICGAGNSGPIARCMSTSRMARS